MCPPASAPLRLQAGSVFTTLLAGIAAVSAVSYTIFQFMSGPVALMTKASRQAETDSQMLSNARILIANATATSVAAADCDADNYVELPSMSSAPGDHPVLRIPFGITLSGGFLPTTLGLRTKDAWGSAYGYCVWDIGAKNDPVTDNGCGANAARLAGTPATVLPTAPAGVQMAMALVSAGPNRKFETTCKSYPYATQTAPGGDGSNQMVSSDTGSDDIVQSYTYDAASRFFSPAWMTSSLSPETAGARTITKNIELGDAGDLAPGATNPDAGDVTDTTGRRGVVTALSLSSAGVLSAGGGLQLADQPLTVTCPAGAPSAAVGTLRYNSADETVEFCANAGGGWTVAGNPGASGDSDTNGISMLKDGVAKIISPFIVGLGQGALCKFNSTAGEYGGCTTGTGTGARNTAAGQDAGAAITSGTDNTALGYRALTANTTGSLNTALGYQALASNLVGANNTAAGARALGLSTASDNTAAGYRALGANTSGAGNSALGFYAMSGNTTASQNTAAGYRALAGNTTGTGNTALGVQALVANITGGQNTAFGYQVLASAETASANTAAGHMAMAYTLSAGTNNAAAGYMALKKNTTGTDNVAIGSQALSAPTVTTGSQNVAIGYRALNVTQGSGLVAIGYNALASSIAGATSVAIGDSALAAATAPSASVAIGYQALSASPSVTSGNIAVGYQAAQNVVDAITNLAVGYQALRNNQTTNDATAFGYRALHNHTGDEGIEPTAFGYRALAGLMSLGTYTDETAFGYQASAAMTSSGANLAIGYRALSSMTGTTLGVAVGSGASQVVTVQAAPHISFGYNAHRSATTNAGVAVGSQAMSSVGSSTQPCTAIGAQAGAGALSCSAANFFFGSQAGAFGEFPSSRSDAFGYQALAWNTGGIANVAFGWRAMSNAGFDGTYNLAIGAEALRDNTTGQRNTALGYQALVANTTGTENSAAGYQALAANTTGAQNSAVGYQAMVANTTGSYNSAIGYQALGVNTTGSYNTAIGYQALNANTTGEYNTSVGYQAGQASAALSSVTCFGYQACKSFAVPSNSIVFGNAAITTLYGQPASWSNFSDRRLKKDIANSDLGLGFVMKLHPVSYRRIQGNGRLEYGFIAQEVEAALGNRPTNIVTAMPDPQKTRMMKVMELVAPITAAVQEQKRAQDSRQHDIDAMKADLIRILAALDGTEAAR